MDIYIFTRADGSEWADFHVPERAEIIRHIHADTADQIRDVIAKETGRVMALAERGLKELLERSQQPEPTIQETPMIVQLRDRKLWGRLRWLLTGK